MEKNQNLTRVAVGGTAWLFGSSVIIQFGSLIAQIVLGWLLSDHDFGLYALAIGVTAVLQVFRDGGVSLWLARQDRSEFDENVRQGFWLCLLGSLLVGFLLAIVAPAAARVYDQPSVCWLIWIVAISLPLDAYGVIIESDLQVALRFKDLSVFRTVAPLIRYAIAITLAWRGWGPMSFVLPLIPVAFVRMVHGYWLTRFAPWQTKVSMPQVWSIFSESRWVFSGTFASSIFRQVDYLVLGLAASTATVGIYFFAFQLAVQPVLLFGQSLRRVLIPTFSRAGDDTERRLRAVVRVAASIGLIASGVFLLFAMLAGVVEHVLWRGRWESAVPAMKWLTAVMPLHLFALLARMIAQSDGRFRLWGAAVVARSIGLAVTVAVAASVWNEQPTAIAAAVAVYLAISSVVEAGFVMQQLKIAPRPVLAAMLPPYLFTLLVAIVCSYLPSLVPWTTDTTQFASLSAAIGACLFVGLFATGAFAFFRSNVDHVWSLRKAMA